MWEQCERAYNIKIDIYLYVYIDIRNISSEIHLIISSTIIFRNDCIYIATAFLLSIIIFIYTRDLIYVMEEFLLRITIQLFEYVIRNIIRLSWKGLSRTLLLHTVIECIVEWRNRLC